MLPPTFEFQTNSHAKIGGDLTVGGNFTVNGTTTIVDSTVIAIGDNMMEMAKDNSSNTMGHWLVWHNKFKW